VLGDVKVAASGGKRRRAGFYSAIRREVPIRTFNDWKGPPPGYCEVDMVAHGGTSVAGSFIQTLTMVDVATGWTECLPLVTRDGSLVVEAIKHVQSLFPWLLRGVDFDNDSAFMNAQSGRTLGRHPHGPGGTRQSHRSSGRKCALPTTCRRWHSTAAGPIIDTGRSCLREKARHDDRGTRSACHAPATEATLQDEDSHAVQARPARCHDRGMACGGATADRARHRRPAQRERSRAVREETTFDCAASA
jgi:hypothetical protein